MYKKPYAWRVEDPVPMDYFRLLRPSQNLYHLKISLNFHFPDGSNVIVPQGTFTNFASVPKLLHFLIDPNDHRLRNGSLIHDFLVGEFEALAGAYGKRYLVDRHGNPQTREQGRAVTWKRAAKIFRAANEANGYPYALNFLAYRFVRYWGDVVHD